MFSKPRLKQCYAIELIEPDALFLISDHRHHVFQGKAFVKLAPLLDGTRNFADILSAIGDDVSFQGLFGALGQLARKGCVVEADGREQHQNQPFWDGFDVNPTKLTEPGKLRLRLQMADARDATLMIQSLAANGVMVDQEAELLAVVTDDYLNPTLAGINKQANLQKTPWFLCKPEGMIQWFGPLFVPGVTGCWECLAHRLRHNRMMEHFIESRNGATRFNLSRANLASSRAAGYARAATEIAKYAVLAEALAPNAFALFTVDVLSLESSEHTLVKRVQCTACGTPMSEQLAHRPIELQARPKSNLHEGRIQSPEATLAEYEHHVSPVTGAVTSLTSREASAHGVSHNYISGHYFPMMADDMASLRIGGFARSGGKGMTEVEAKVSAVCESLERYCGIYWGEETTRFGSYSSMREIAYPIRALTLNSDKQIAARDQWNSAARSTREMVPFALHDDTEIHWSGAWSLTHGTIKYLPTAYCYYGFRESDMFFCASDSNGNAAGNCLEEAILQGLLELIERDAVAIWWYNRVRLPAVDMTSFGLKFWDEMSHYYEHELNRELHVLDLTADIPVPTFAVVSRRRGHPVEDILLGFGCHLDPATAMHRALGEANQYLPALRTFAADGSTIYRHNQLETVHWWKTATFEKQPYLCPSPDHPSRLLAQMPCHASADLRDDIETCVKLLAAAQLEVLVLDQTRPDIGLSVVKVVVPGLRHFWRRLAPGRLYDVPVKLGWRASRIAEEDVNPIACFV